MMKTVVAALAACALTPALLAAGAHDPLTKASVTMKLDHLNLTTVEGQRVLASRMDRAARDVCGDKMATIHLALDAQSRACQTEVKADIRSRIEQRTADAGSLTQTGAVAALR